MPTLIYLAVFGFAIWGVVLNAETFNCRVGNIGQAVVAQSVCAPGQTPIGKIKEWNAERPAERAAKPKVNHTYRYNPETGRVEEVR